MAQLRSSLLLLLLLLVVCCTVACINAADVVPSEDEIICPLFCLENVKYSKCKSLGPRRLPGACNCCLLRRALLESSRYRSTPPSKCSLYLSHGKVVKCDF